MALSTSSILRGRVCCKRRDDNQHANWYYQLAGQVECRAAIMVTDQYSLAYACQTALCRGYYAWSKWCGGVIESLIVVWDEIIGILELSAKYNEFEVIIYLF